MDEERSQPNIDIFGVNISKMPRRCFVSHAFAQRRTLEFLKLSVPDHVELVIFERVDISGMTEDQSIGRMIAECIRGCDGLICIEDNYVNSKWLPYECAIAAKLGKPIFQFMSMDKIRTIRGGELTNEYMSAFPWDALWERRHELKGMLGFFSRLDFPPVKLTDRVAFLYSHEDCPLIEELRQLIEVHCGLDLYIGGMQPVDEPWRLRYSIAECLALFCLMTEASAARVTTRFVREEQNAEPGLRKLLHKRMHFVALDSAGLDKLVAAGDWLSQRMNSFDFDQAMSLRYANGKWNLQKIDQLLCILTLLHFVMRKRGDVFEDGPKWIKELLGEAQNKE